MGETLADLKKANAQLRKKCCDLEEKLAGLSAEALKFSNFIQQHDTVMLLVDPLTGKIVDANNAAVQFYGYTEKELRSRNMRDLYVNPAQYLNGDASGRAEKKKSVNLVNHRLADGKIRQVEIHSSPIPYKSETVIFSIVLDVTERIESEQRLQFKQTIQSLISSISAYFIRPDHHQIDIAITNALESVTKFLNTEYGFLLRFSEDLTTFELTQQWHDKARRSLMIPSGTETDNFPALSGELLRGGVFQCSDTSEIPDATEKSFYSGYELHSVIVLPMIAAGMVIGGIGLGSVQKTESWNPDSVTILRIVGEIIVNTLARKQTEDALRASEKKYRIFFEEDLTADYVADAEGRILFCNQAFAEIFGYESAHHANNCNLRELDSVTGELTEILELLKTTDFIERKEIELRRVDGEQVHVIGNFRAGYDEHGNRTESRGYLFDITEHKRTEDQLRGAQKMEAIGRLAGGVAHDFNNLLTVINGYGDLLLESETFSEVDKNRVGQIRKAGDRAAGLTGQLLAFSRRQIIQPKIINLNTVIVEFEKMLQRLIGENIKIVNELSSELSKVKIDPTQLEQIIINLAVNARDAMPDGGNLYVRTSNVSLDRKFAQEHRPIQPGEYVVLEVADTGIGMSEDVSSHIFEPFFTTKEQGKGTGLGLSTIYGIVKQANGYIWVDSTLNKGTRFYIYFPPVLDAKPESETRSQAADEKLHGGENILVIEDDLSVRELTCAFLETYGYKVFQAADAKSALAFIRQNPNQIDMAVIDVIMPDMGGKQLSEKLAEYKAGLKTLFMSGYTDDNIVRFGILNPDVHFLQKPFTAAQLTKKVRFVLDSPDTKN